MAKIKRKVEMTLPKLIEWAWENDVKEKVFYSNIDVGSVYFDMVQTVFVEHAIAKDETFTVEVEEEINEDTVLPMFVEIFTDASYEICTDIHENKSVKEVIKTNPNHIITKTFNLINNDGTTTLIWKDGAMVDD